MARQWLGHHRRPDANGQHHRDHRQHDVQSSATPSAPAASRARWSPAPSPGVQCQVPRGMPISQLPARMSRATSAPCNGSSADWRARAMETMRPMYATAKACCAPRVVVRGATSVGGEHHPERGADRCCSAPRVTGRQGRPMTDRASCAWRAMPRRRTGWPRWPRHRRPIHAGAHRVQARDGTPTRRAGHARPRRPASDRAG